MNNHITEIHDNPFAFFIPFYCSDFILHVTTNSLFDLISHRMHLTTTCTSGNHKIVKHIGHIT